MIFLNLLPSDSAGTATAYLCGVKTRMGYIGVDATADANCSMCLQLILLQGSDLTFFFLGTKQGHLEPIAKRATRTGKVAGVVTTTTITHATPSPLYAKLPAPLRPFEYRHQKYSKFEKDYSECDDIASQFVSNAQHLKVAFGGGRAYFTPDTENILVDRKKGLRNDGRNLIEVIFRLHSKTCNEF